MTQRPLAHWLLLLALVAMWGSAFLLTKAAVQAVPPTALVAIRLLLALLVLGGLLLLQAKRLPRDRTQWGFFLAMAVTGNCLPFWLISWGQQRIDSGLAGILMAVMPLTTLVLAHFFVSGERLSPNRALGFLLGFAGIVVLVGPDALLELQGQGTALLSELAVLGGAVCYACNTIIARRRPPSDPIVAAAGVMLVGSAIMLPGSALDRWPEVAALSGGTIAAVGFLGLVSTALATVVYLRLVTAAGPGFVALINYLIPLYAVAGGWLFFDEVPSWSALAALAMILGGIALSERRRSA